MVAAWFWHLGLGCLRMGHMRKAQLAHYTIVQPASRVHKTVNRASTEAPFWPELAWLALKLLMSCHKMQDQHTTPLYSFLVLRRLRNLTVPARGLRGVGPEGVCSSRAI